MPLQSVWNTSEAMVVPRHAATQLFYDRACLLSSLWQKNDPIDSGGLDVVTKLEFSYFKLEVFKSFETLEFIST